MSRLTLETVSRQVLSATEDLLKEKFDGDTTNRNLQDNERPWPDQAENDNPLQHFSIRDFTNNRLFNSFLMKQIREIYELDGTIVDYTDIAFYCDRDAKLVAFAIEFTEPEGKGHVELIGYNKLHGTEYSIDIPDIGDEDSIDEKVFDENLISCLEDMMYGVVVWRKLDMAMRDKIKDELFHEGRNRNVKPKRTHLELKKHEVGKEMILHLSEEENQYEFKEIERSDITLRNTLFLDDFKVVEKKKKKRTSVGDSDESVIDLNEEKHTMKLYEPKKTNQVIKKDFDPTKFERIKAEKMRKAEEIKNRSHDAFPPIKEKEAPKVRFNDQKNENVWDMRSKAQSSSQCTFEEALANLTKRIDDLELENKRLKHELFISSKDKALEALFPVALDFAAKMADVMGLSRTERETEQDARELSVYWHEKQFSGGY